MSELLFHLNCRFSDNDKEQCLPMIFTIAEWAQIARQEGLLALDAKTEHESNFFLRTGLKLVVDGTDPVLVKRILHNLILSEEYSGVELLSRLIVAEGILRLQAGENPQHIKLLLCSMLGEKYLCYANETEVVVTERLAKVRQFLKALKDKEIPQEHTELEQLILNLSDRDIQKILLNADPATLCPALHGLSYAAIKKIFDNMTISICSQIIDELAIRGRSYDSIKHAEESIMEIVKRLEDQGEIILARMH